MLQAEVGNGEGQPYQFLQIFTEKSQGWTMVASVIFII